MERRVKVIILDNASWHKRKSMNWNGRQPLYLPPHSPDFKPIEPIQRVMKANRFSNYVCKNVDKLIEHLDKAILYEIDNPERTNITTSIGTLI